MTVVDQALAVMGDAKAEIERLRKALGQSLEMLETVHDEIERFVDTKDSDLGPRPNWAMSLTQEIDEVLADITHAAIVPVQPPAKAGEANQ